MVRTVGEYYSVTSTYCQTHTLNILGVLQSLDNVGIIKIYHTGTELWGKKL